MTNIAAISMLASGVMKSIAKSQVFINSINSSIHCKTYNRKWKYATGNRK